MVLLIQVGNLKRIEQKPWQVATQDRMNRRKSVSLTSLRPKGKVDFSPVGSPPDQRQTSSSSIITVASHESGDRSPVFDRVTRLEQVVAKKRLQHERKKDKKKVKKLKEHDFQIDKIGKEDFLSKRLEFRTWLLEEKKKHIEHLSDAKCKEYFKKFIKKWNSKKLSLTYYRGVNPCWINGSPLSVLGMTTDYVQCTPSSVTEETLEEKYCRKGNLAFNTFGKRLGRRGGRNVHSFNFEEISPEQFGAGPSLHACSMSPFPIKPSRLDFESKENQSEPRPAKSATKWNVDDVLQRNKLFKRAFKQTKV